MIDNEQLQIAHSRAAIRRDFCPKFAEIKQRNADVLVIPRENLRQSKDYGRQSTRM